MKKIIISLAFLIVTTFNIFALGGKNKYYELIPVAPQEFEIVFTKYEYFINFVERHADFIEVRYIDENTLSAGIFIDERYGMCLLD